VRLCACPHRRNRPGRCPQSATSPQEHRNITLTTPTDPNTVSAFINIRVADIDHVHREWSARGAQFVTDPVDRGNEIRAYIRDPDGHLIEVGQWQIDVVDRSSG
jgi:catechol 2,3-dioxygenase-like lactoylglutathione lyase family enzyme